MKKKRMIFIIAAAAASVMLFGCTGTQNVQEAESPESPAAVQTEAAATQEEREMTVTSSGIAGGVMDPKYGAKGELNAEGMPVVSLPLSVENAPDGTACFAVYMDDPDSKPLSGRSWVHWMAVNIPGGSIPEDFSRNAAGKAVQGENDFGESGYGGPTPPDRDHTYVIAVYALDQVLPLEEGFSKSEFEQALEGHVLASAKTEGLYKK